MAHLECKDMDENNFLMDVNDIGVATITLNRPNVHNAIDDKLISDLVEQLRILNNDDSVRVIVLTGNGPSFCSGADLNWMKRMAKYNEAENLRDAHALAKLLMMFASSPKPTVALVQGDAFAGGLGFICSCDIAISVNSATFAITEVRLGLMPSLISPFLISAIGERSARRYFLTAERFNAETAKQIGLVQMVVPDSALSKSGEELINKLLKGGPSSLAKTKALINKVKNSRLDENLMSSLSKGIAEIRSSNEAQEGMAAFLEKRKPYWQ